MNITKAVYKCLSILCVVGLFSATGIAATAITGFGVVLQGVSTVVAHVASGDWLDLQEDIVLDHSAVGNGVADDGPALTAALTITDISTDADGDGIKDCAKTIMVPAGEFRLGTFSTWSVSHCVRIMGEGRQSILDFEGKVAPFTLAGSTGMVRFDNLTIRDVSTNFIRFTDDATATHQFIGGDDVWFEDVAPSGSGGVIADTNNDENHTVKLMRWTRPRLEASGQLMIVRSEAVWEDIQVINPYTDGGLSNNALAQIGSSATAPGNPVQKVLIKDFTIKNQSVNSTGNPVRGMSIEALRVVIEGGFCDTVKNTGTGGVEGCIRIGRAEGNTTFVSASDVHAYDAGCQVEADESFIFKPSFDVATGFTTTIVSNLTSECPGDVGTHFAITGSGQVTMSGLTGTGGSKCLNLVKGTESDQGRWLLDQVQCKGIDSTGDGIIAEIRGGSSIAFSQFVCDDVSHNSSAIKCMTWECEDSAGCSDWSVDQSTFRNLLENGGAGGGSKARAIEVTENGSGGGNIQGVRITNSYFDGMDDPGGWIDDGASDTTTGFVWFNNQFYNMDDNGGAPIIANLQNSDGWASYPYEDGDPGCIFHDDDNDGVNTSDCI